ncbi:MAG: pyridoxal-phosphate dependent enzyme, partial [Cyclobacteriaceae bacterium]
MKFYSTKNSKLRISLREAVLHGQPADGGLYMPERIPVLPQDFFRSLPTLSFSEIGFEVAHALLGDDLSNAELHDLTEHTLTFPAPVVEVDPGLHSLELFHGPTLAFKDFGARFLAWLVGYFARQERREITILVATSGDTGGAVAQAFFQIPGTRVVVLYPRGRVSLLQEKQFATLGANITALEVDGSFDDCQRLVKQAFADIQIRQEVFLTSANSINIARLIPQMFYYFRGYAQVQERKQPVVFSV